MKPKPPSTDQVVGRGTSVKDSKKDSGPVEPFTPEANARIVEFIRSMTRDELIEFLEYREPGVPEYWLGKPVRRPRLRSPRASKNGAETKL